MKIPLNILRTITYAMVISRAMIDVRLIVCKTRFHLVRTALLRSY